MKIFRLRVNVEEYRWIHPVGGDSVWKTGLLDFMGDKKENWKPLQCYVGNLKQKTGNFYEFASGSLVFDKAVYEGMGDILEMGGEILPLEMEEGGQLYLLNVLECINALDKGKSEWKRTPEGQKMYLTKYAFHSNRILESSLFKIPEGNYSSVLTYSGVKDTADEFKGRYEQLGLTGLIFEELWSDDVKNMAKNMRHP